MDLVPCLIIPDTHRPYHHKKAYKLMLEVAKSVNPQHIYILGDYADFYAVNGHGKHPQLMQLLRDEVCDVIQGLEELDQMFPDAKKTFIEGNHEYRLERYLMQNAPALFGVTSTEDILQLRDRPNWKFIPYGPQQMVRVGGSKLVARHEPLASTAKAAISRAMSSVIYGHIHKREMSYAVDIFGIEHVACSVGWLGDKRLDKIYGYVKAHHNWNMGFGFVWVDPKTGHFFIDPIHILQVGNNVICHFNGKLFKL